MHRKHKGAYHELMAAAWLLSNGYEVFRNVSPHGSTDLIGIKNGVVERFDVKSNEYGKVASGIKRLVVAANGCTVVADRTVSTKQCKHCGTEFQSKRKNGSFCSKRCAIDASRVKKPKPKEPQSVQERLADWEARPRGGYKLREPNSIN